MQNNVPAAPFPLSPFHPVLKIEDIGRALRESFGPGDLFYDLPPNGLSLIDLCRQIPG